MDRNNKIIVAVQPTNSRKMLTDLFRRNSYGTQRNTDKKMKMVSGRICKILHGVNDNEFKIYKMKSVFTPLDTTNFCYFENIVKMPKLLYLNALILMLSHGVNP
ncbi:MAG TPA: hypothetical protein DHW42_05125 [Candidatus Marinimicrobia bacterium]|nr:hypothetical protein [Candidatus Neomarinimicrobiota bacterium]